MSVDVNYYSFSPNRAGKNWKNFEEDFAAVRKWKAGDKEVKLTLRQKDLEENSYAGDIFYPGRLDDYTIRYGLKAIDLFYGSIINKYFESPKVEFNFVEKLVIHFKAETESLVPTKKEWIRIFETMTADDMRSVAIMIRKDIGWDEDESMDELVSYLQSVKPVVADLKKTEDSIFVRWYGGTDEVEPMSSEEMLNKHVQKYREKFSHLLEQE